MNMDINICRSQAVDVGRCQHGTRSRHHDVKPKKSSLVTEIFNNSRKPRLMKDCHFPFSMIYIWTSQRVPKGLDVNLSGGRAYVTHKLRQCITGM